MIKAVLFDFGGVLSEGGKTGAIRNIFAKAYGVSADSLRFEKSGLQALKGQITDDEFLAAMNQRHPSGTPVTKAQFLSTADHLNPSKPVYRLARMLRDHHIKTGLLSNTLEVTAQSLRQRGLYDGFDPVLLSCQAHSLKPEPEFYKLALRMLGLAPAEILFIDDLAQFLEPAKAMGMHTILAVSPGQIVQNTKELLQKENGLTL